MARPATNARPTCWLLSAAMTGAPRPGPSIRAAIVAIDSAAITDWLMPTMIVRFAIGSWTLRSRCQPL